MNYLANAGQILIAFVFNILVGLVLLRVLLQMVRADFHNPICQFLYKTTNPVLIPLRRLIPPWRRIDNAGLVLAWLLLVLKRGLLFALSGSTPGAAGLLVLAVADLLGFLLMLLLVLIVLRAILSFVSSDQRHPVVPLVIQLTQPILRPLQRRLPALGGIDFSPLLALLAIMLLQALLVQPLLDLGMHLASAA